MIVSTGKKCRNVMPSMLCCGSPLWLTFKQSILDKFNVSFPCSSLYIASEWSGKEELVFFIMCLCDFQSNYLSLSAVTGIEFLIDSELGFCQRFCQCVQVSGSYTDKHFQMF